MKKYLVTLTAEERQQLRHLIAVGKASAKKLTYARILLKADVNTGGLDWTDTRIAEAVEVSVATVERVRQWFASPSGERLRTSLRSCVGWSKTSIPTLSRWIRLRCT